VFVGWVGETYETMPAHDVTYIANIVTGIDQLTIEKTQMKIYDLNGRRVSGTIQSGIYFVEGKKVFVRQ
jgi:hypothetical protein